jgi:hypothetical protein
MARLLPQVDIEMDEVGRRLIGLLAQNLPR